MASLLLLAAVLLCQALTGYLAFHVSTPANTWKARTIFGGITLAGMICALFGHWADQKDALIQSKESQTPIFVAIRSLQQEERTGFDSIRKPPQPPALPSAKALKPDITLKLFGPLSPTVVLVNNSGALATNIKWGLFLWNLDDPRTYVSAGQPADGHDPLPIPVSTFDFIVPHAFGGAQDIFGLPSVAPFVKTGNRLAGLASVICATCSRGHTYFVYIVYGKGGWYAELKQFKKAEFPTPQPMTRANVAAVFGSAIQNIPESQRIPIGEVHGGPIESYK